MKSKPRGSLSDWLALHSLDKETVWAFLRLLNLHSGLLFSDQEPHEDQKLNFDADEAWNLVAGAMRAKLPELSCDIEHVRTVTEREFNAEPGALPFTRKGSAKGGTLVSICYQAAPQDLLCVAHEFGHALQIELSERRFTPPIHREIAAFLSELFLLEHAQKTDPGLHHELWLAWQDENGVYLGEDLEFLEDQLTQEGAPYDYRLNYPLARLIAFHLWKSSTVSDVTEWFARTMNLQSLATRFKYRDKDAGMQNNLPQVPQIEEELPAINAYRSLGIMALLDIEYLEGVSEQQIGDYYSDLLAHMRSQTAIVAMDDDRKPIGYATWIADDAQPPNVKITRQAVPFGHHLELQRQLERQLPEGSNVVSFHARSARSEQAAW